MDYYHKDFTSTLHAPIPRRASVSEYSLSLPEGGQYEASFGNVYDYELGGLNGSFIPPTFVALDGIPAGLHGLNNPTFTSEANDIHGGMDLSSIHDGYDHLYSESMQKDFEPLGFSSEAASGFNNHYLQSNSDFSAFAPSPTSSTSSSASLSLELMTPPIDPSGLTPPPFFESPEVETQYTLPLLPSLDLVKEETFTPVMEEAYNHLHNDFYNPFAYPIASSASASASLTQEIMIPVYPTGSAGPHFSQFFETGTQTVVPLLPSLDSVKEETFTPVMEEAYNHLHIGFYNPFAYPIASSASASAPLTQEIMIPAYPTGSTGPHFSQFFETGTQTALPLLLSLDSIKQETVAPVMEDTVENPQSAPPALDASPAPVKDEALISHRTSPESAAVVPSASSSSTSLVNTPQVSSIDEDRIPCIYDDCSVTFVDVRGRNRHIRHIHLGERIFCPGMCHEEGFSRPDSLNRHLLSLGGRTKCRREARKWGWRPKTKGSINKLWDFIPDLTD
ncbi:hypothetical protein ACEPAG_2504 [Sanghuangporus baumii]